MVVLVKHDQGCPFRTLNKPHSDAAQRVYDTYHLHRMASTNPFDVYGKWFAVALNNGMSDGIIYDSKNDAIRHQHHNEMWYAYIQVTQANMTVCSAEVMLTTTRRLYDAGFRMVDPGQRGGGKQVITRNAYEDVVAQMRLRPTNLSSEEKE